MSEYVWYKDGKEIQRSLDVDGKLVSKKIISDDEYVKYDYYEGGNIGSEHYFRNDRNHREGDKPAIILYGNDGSIKGVSYWIDGERRREGDKPTLIRYYEDGSIKGVFYIENDEYHRDGDKPAIIKYNKDGSVNREEYYKNGMEYELEVD